MTFILRQLLPNIFSVELFLLYYYLLVHIEVYLFVIFLVYFKNNLIFYITYLMGLLQTIQYIFLY